MDFEDDPDITPWHLSQRMIMLVELAEEEKKKEELALALAQHSDDPDKLLYTCKNVVLRVLIGCAFLGICIGLLAFSIEHEESETTTTETRRLPPITTPAKSNGGTSTQNTTSSLVTVPNSAVQYSGLINVTLMGNKTKDMPFTWYQNDKLHLIKLSLGNKENDCHSFFAEILHIENEIFVNEPGSKPGCKQIKCLHDTTNSFYNKLKHWEELEIQIGLKGHKMLRLNGDNVRLMHVDFLFINEINFINELPDFINEIDKLRKNVANCSTVENVHANFQTIIFKTIIKFFK